MCITFITCTIYIISVITLLISCSHGDYVRHDKAYT